MKKQYIKPTSAIVRIRLFGNVLDNITLTAKSFVDTTDTFGARDGSNRFDWDDDEEESVNIWK